MPDARRVRGAGCGAARDPAAHAARRPARVAGADRAGVDRSGRSAAAVSGGAAHAASRHQRADRVPGPRAGRPLRLAMAGQARRPEPVGRHRAGRPRPRADGQRAVGRRWAGRRRRGGGASLRLRVRLLHHRHRAGHPASPGGGHDLHRLRRGQRVLGFRRAVVELPVGPDARRRQPGRPARSLAPAAGAADRLRRRAGHTGAVRPAGVVAARAAGRPRDPALDLGAGRRRPDRLGLAGPVADRLAAGGRRDWCSPASWSPRAWSAASRTRNRSSAAVLTKTLRKPECAQPM